VRGRVLLVGLVMLGAAGAVSRTGAQAAVYLSWRDKPDHKAVSPDGAYALYSSGDSPAAVWIEELHTQKRREVLISPTGTVSVAWSPDSRAFFVNDHVASNVDRAYVYDAQTLSRLDLAALVVGGDPGAQRFTAPFVLEAPKFAPGVRVADHSHLVADRWLDADHVDVVLAGHTDSTGTPEHIRPSQCFRLHYRISKSGEVRKLGQEVADEGTKACDVAEVVP